MQFLYNNKIFKDRRRDLRKQQTDVEKMLWRRLRRKQFYGLKFYRQYSVSPYILDFYCPKFKLAIELDGSQHAEEEQEQYDTTRTAYLQEREITIVRFWNNEVISNMEGILTKLADMLHLI